VQPEDASGDTAEQPDGGGGTGGTGSGVARFGVEAAGLVMALLGQEQGSSFGSVLVYVTINAALGNDKTGIGTITTLMLTSAERPRRPLFLAK
jgi:hypothetical protein